jgi:hypothetical protein
MIEELKSVAEKLLPEKLAIKLKRLLGDRRFGAVPFDNTYPWLNYTFLRVMKDSLCAQRPQYAWGVIQGAALAKALGILRISVLEFGVAGGCGLAALERIAETVEKETKVDIEVFGFDTGVGLPKPVDSRDQPNMWFEGQLPMNKEKLQSSLARAQLCLGPVGETVPSFLADRPAPVAFVSFDLDLYSSTRDALSIFQSAYENVLPRVVSYFDDIFGHSYNEYCGERLAISEFNSIQDKRKICPIYGLRYFLPRVAFTELWPDGMYFAHFFEHPLYNNLDSFNKAVLAEIDGTVLRRHPDSDWKSRFKA